jgi:putative transcriptional regulator
MHSFQGHFLVAAPWQHDPNFVETVILVVEHSDRGAFGVILNCPRERRQISPRQRRTERSVPVKARMFSGGPVTGPLMAVHADRAFAEREILPGVFFAGKEKNVVPLIRQSKHPYKIFMGYAGWGSGQLEYEIEQGLWRVVPATAEQVFSVNDKLWEQLSRQVFEMQVQSLFNISHVPANPEWN